MIVEFALSLTLSLPHSALPVVPVNFTDPVQQVVTYPPVGALKQISGLPLPPGTQEAFDNEFLDGSVYFGAFAVTKDFAYGYVTGANSIEAARDIATQECLKHGSGCLIYAEILPVGYEPLPAGSIALAPEAADYYNNPDPSWGSYRAMAVSEDGAYSVVWNHPTPIAANVTALADCNSYVIDDLPDLRPMPCVLIPLE